MSVYLNYYLEIQNKPSVVTAPNFVVIAHYEKSTNYAANYKC